MKQTIAGVIARHKWIKYNSPGEALGAVCDDLLARHGITATHKGRSLYVSGEAVAWVKIEEDGGAWRIVKYNIYYAKDEERAKLDPSAARRGRYTPVSALARLRVEKGLTQKQLAEMVGAPQNTLANWESRGRMPGNSMLRALADALGCTEGALLEGAEPFTRAKHKGAQRGKYKACVTLSNGVQEWDTCLGEYEKEQAAQDALDELAAQGHKIVKTWIEGGKQNEEDAPDAAP